MFPTYRLGWKAANALSNRPFDQIVILQAEIKRLREKELEEKRKEEEMMSYMATHALPF